jgi:hypothetical protein
MPPITIDGQQVQEVTIDGQQVQQVTIDGQVAFSAINEIPDSGNLHAHYDLNKQTESDGAVISTLVDQSGNGHDASALGQPTMSATGFNNNPTAILDGNNDGWEVTGSDFNTLTQPFTAYWVGSLDGSLSVPNHLFDAAASTERAIMAWGRDGQFWSMWSGNWLRPVGNENDHIVAAVYNGSSSVLETPSGQLSGNAGTNGLSRLPLGFKSGSFDGFFDGRWSEFALYNAGHDATTRSEFMSYAQSVWNI